MKEKKQNLHNHTIYSDGSFSWEQLVREAEKCDIGLLGISDHFFTSKVYHNISPSEWLSQKIPEYQALAEDIRAYSSGNSGYNGNIRKTKVLIGIEIDTVVSRTGLNIPDLPWSFINSLDYVLFEYLGEDDIRGTRLHEAKLIAEFCSIPKIIAHPNLDRLDCFYGIKACFDFLAEHGFAVEIPSGSRNDWFWNRFDPQLLKNMVLSIGTDTHEKLSEAGNINRALKFIEDNNLTENLIDL
ncbi:MAG: hypothetical protein HQM10_12390 [Candidatus Riflebacteria bacterium]|nr:hypothetical protein [Candidatus Riflebacteria bacterium]